MCTILQTKSCLEVLFHLTYLRLRAFLTMSVYGVDFRGLLHPPTRKIRVLGAIMITKDSFYCILIFIFDHLQQTMPTDYCLLFIVHAGGTV